MQLSQAEAVLWHGSCLWISTDFVNGQQKLAKSNAWPQFEIDLHAVPKIIIMTQPITPYNVSLVINYVELEKW